MATHSSFLAWRISWTEEPGRLESTGSQSQIRSKRLSKQKKSRMDYQKTKGSHPGKIILPWPTSGSEPVFRPRNH